MNNYMNKHTILILALTLTFISSCAAPERKFPKIVWPLPPEAPKVRFVETLQSNLDVEEAGGFLDAIAGAGATAVLSKPYGIAADKDGRIYVTDRGVVFVFDRKDKKLWFIGIEEGPEAIKHPSGVAVSERGKIYVSDTGHDRVLVYNRSGKFLTTIGSAKGEFENPIGLAVDDQRDRLYVVDSKKHRVSVYDLEGKFLFDIGKLVGDTGGFHTPSNIALDRAGNLYVVDTFNFRVQVFDPEGKYIRSLGQLGDVIGEFSRPKGIAIDSEDHVYVVDAAFQNVQVFDKEGKILMFFGGGGSAYGRFFSPAGIAIDNEDRIYVADTLNMRVQVFEYLGEKWKQRQAAQPQQPVEKK